MSFEKKHRTKVLWVLTLVMTIAVPLNTQEIWVNCGGEEYTDRFGHHFSQDTPYNSDTGYGYEGGDPFYLSGSAVYISDKYDVWGILARNRQGKTFKYLYDVEPGKYVITLYFCDHRGRYPDSYLFEVLSNRWRILRNYSIYNDGERLHHVIRRRIFENKKEQLEVRLQPSLNTEGEALAQLTAIGLTPLDTSAPLPQPPQKFHVIESYGMNALLWAHAGEHTVEGYNVYRLEKGEFFRLNDSTIKVARYYDWDVDQGKCYSYCLTCANLRGSEGGVSQTLQATPLDAKTSRLPRYNIKIEPSLLDSMHRDLWSENYTPCKFHYEENVCSAGIRFRGRFSRSIGIKMSWKVRFDTAHPSLEDTKLNLKTEIVDASLLREAIVFLTSEDFGLPTIQRQYIHLQINERFHGVFLQKEQIDADFLQRRGITGNGNLYKVEDGDIAPCAYENKYKEKYEKDMGDVDDYGDLISFIMLIDTTPDVRFAEELSTNLDLRNFASWYALNNLMVNGDFYWGNYYLYHPPDGRWLFIPSDCDLTLRPNRSDEIIELENTHPLFSRFLSVPSFKMAYCNRFYQIISLYFTEETIMREVDSLYHLIEIDGACDVWKHHGEDTAYFPAQYENLRNWLLDRRTHLLSGGIEQSMPQRSVQLKINEIAAQPYSWVELVNAGENSINLAGFHYDIDLGQPGRWELPDTVLEPEGVILLNEKDGALLHLSGKGGEVVVFDAAGEPVDAVFYDYIAPGSSFGRYQDGEDNWKIMSLTTPGKLNAPQEEETYVRITPNPMMGVVSIRVKLPEPGSYSIKIYDLTGRRARYVIRETNSTRYDTFVWKGTDDYDRPLPAAPYFIVVEVKGETIGSAKIVLLK